MDLLMSETERRNRGFGVIDVAVSPNIALSDSDSVFYGSKFWEGLSWKLAKRQNNG